MQQYLKYLVVEDEPAWAKALSESIAGYFIDRNILKAGRIDGRWAKNGGEGNDYLLTDEFDLVTLDMNLGEGENNSRISGLDLLGEIAASNRAYFVIIVTGAVNDPQLERLYGKDAASIMRFGVMNEAVKLLPAERICVLNKPAKGKLGDAMNTLRPHLFSALDQYCRVSRERNIFRPLPKHASLWEVRYNGGMRLTIPCKEPFRIIREVLSQPNEALKVIGLVQAIAQSSGKATMVSTRLPKRVVAGNAPSDDLEIDWEERSGYSVSDDLVANALGVDLTAEDLIAALMTEARKHVPAAKTMAQYEKAFGIGPLLMLQGKITHYLSHFGELAKKIGGDYEPNELFVLNNAIAPLMPEYRRRHKEEAARPSKATPKEKKIRVARGPDVKEFELARAHWMRAMKCLSEYSALKQFRDHLTGWVARGRHAKGRIEYRAPDGSPLAPFWLTE